MREFHRYKKFFPLGVFVLLLLSLAGVFFLRSPVVIVTDPSFLKLYGEDRSRLKTITNSLELFRRFVPVVVDESAGARLTGIAVEQAFRSPGAVLFPYRYMEGARLYKQNHPEVPVLVIGQRDQKSPDQGEKSLRFVRTDMDLDLYRAGLCAAFLARGSSRVLFFNDGSLQFQYREAFREGLRSQGVSLDAVYLDAAADYSSYTGVGCVVVAGPAVKFLEKNLKIPIILFSWADPSMTPRTVKLIFDDSPLAVAVKAMKASSSGEILISSQPVLFPDRIEEKNEFQKLQTLTRQVR